MRLLFLLFIGFFMSCDKCYSLTISGSTDTWTLRQRPEGNVWFDSSGNRVNDSAVISSLFTAIDSEVKRANAEVLCSNGAACADENEQAIEHGDTSPIPSGFHTVTIVNLTGTTTVNGGFPLGVGRAPRSLSLSSTNHTCLNDVLPEITLSGGTFQWIGVK